MTNLNGSCNSFPEQPEDCDTINILRRVFGAFSCISCLFVIFVIWVFGRYSAMSQRLIVSLSVAALFNGFGRLFQDSTNEQNTWCVMQAFWLNYFNYAVMLWVVCITCNLFINVIKGITTTRFERWYHGLCWGLSLFVSLLPFIGNHYGPSGSWCWIVKDVGWQMGIYYIPLFTVIIVVTVIYVYINITLYRQTSNWAGTFDAQTRQEQEKLKEEIKPLRLYPFVFLLLSLFPLINRIQNLTSDGHHVFGLVLLHAFSASVQGAAYSLVFAIDLQTLRSLTPAQIKAAILKKRAAPAIVQEYPAAVISTADTQAIVDSAAVEEEDDTRSNDSN